MATRAPGSGPAPRGAARTAKLNEPTMTIRSFPKRRASRANPNMIGTSTIAPTAQATPTSVAPPPSATIRIE